MYNVVQKKEGNYLLSGASPVPFPDYMLFETGFYLTFLSRIVSPSYEQRRIQIQRNFLLTFDFCLNQLYKKNLILTWK